MARTVRDASLETRTARLRLKPSGKPYYRAVDEGLHIGYRRGKTAGKWVMRSYLGNQAYRVEPLGSADDTLDADGSEFLTFAQAQAKARALFVENRRLAAGLPADAGPYTVRLCVEEYIGYLEQHKKTAKDARWRADALILPQLGQMECARLTTKDLRDWRDAAAEAPPRLRTKKGGKQKFAEKASEPDPAESRRRRRASVNRVLTILKAALNQAWRDQKIGSDQAWRAVTPFPEADAARIRYLTVKEATRLINACSGAFRDLVHAALQTGCRFGELAALRVGDFNPDSKTLHIRTSKSGKGRHVVLTEEGIALFTGLCAGRSARDTLLYKESGERWAKSNQARPMAEACKAARIDPPAGFHTLRHSYASLSVMNGVPLMVVARNLGHVDTRMVEKHYGHMSTTYVTDAIKAGAPRFGIEADKKVMVIGGPS